MKLPGHKIHDVVSGYGKLIIPIFEFDRYGNMTWLAWFEDHGLKRTSWLGFHDCTKTGIN